MPSRKPHRLHSGKWIKGTEKREERRPAGSNAGELWYRKLWCRERFQNAIWWPKAERQGGGWLEFTNVHSSREKAMATHSSTLAWKIPWTWTEEPGRLQSMGSLRIRHD